MTSIARATLSACLVVVAGLVACGPAAATPRHLPGGPPGPGASLTAASPALAPPGVLAYVSDSDFYGSSGKEVLLTAFPDGAHQRTLLKPASVGVGLLQFSPTGRRLAYFRASSSGARVDVMNVATRHVVAVLDLRNTNAYVDGVSWTPDGRDLIVGTNERPGGTTVRSEFALWRIPVTGGKPARLTPYEDAGDPAVLPDGDVVYVVSTTFSSDSVHASALWRTRPDGSHPERILKSSHFVDGPVVAANGTLLAYSVVVNDTTTHLESYTLSSGRKSALTPLVKGRTDVSPAWSPDGRDIVFLSSRDGRYATSKSHPLLDAYVITAAGRHTKKEIARSGDKWSLIVIAWGR